MKFSEGWHCGHCGNFAPMQIVAEYSEIKLHVERESKNESWEWSDGNVYEVLLCPACKCVELRRHYYHDGLEDPDYKTLYPVSTQIPLGLPKRIQQEYEAALKVRSISANAYGVLMGRVLELVCEDRKAKGNSLYGKLTDLAKSHEIPDKLLPVADKLRIFRNVGAHSALGELTAAETPILDNLSRAILEYVYSAPHLVEAAASALEKLHKRKKTLPKG